MEISVRVALLNGGVSGMRAATTSGLFQSPMMERWPPEVTAKLTDNILLPL